MSSSISKSPPYRPFPGVSEQRIVRVIVQTGFCTPTPSAVAHGCTTEARNTHKTELFVRDRRPEVLDFDQPFADKDHLGNFVDAIHPGVANELRIQGQRTLGFFGVSAGGRQGRLPLERATDAVKAAAYPDVRVSEYKGGNAVDVTAGASGSSASANSGSVHLRPFSC